MTHVQQQSSNEKALQAELIISIALRATEFLLAADFDANRQPRQSPDMIKSLVIDHQFTSDFEGACWVLLQAGAVRAVNRNLAPVKWGPCFQFLFDVPELRKHLTQVLPIDTLSIGKTLEAFLAIASDFGSSQPITTRRIAFRVPTGYERLFELLAICGYAERHDDWLKWTDKIAPMMQKAFAWDKRNRSLTDLFQAEIDSMWRSMPAGVRNEFFAGDEPNLIELAFVIEKSWRKGKWQNADAPNIQPSSALSFPDCVIRAEALQDKYRGSN